MSKRKSLSNKIRFEVFKRDNFTCQYCGKSAPEVVLNVDHIEPISEGGTNDLFNLITSCFECNNGKRDKKLDDKSELEKQHNELVILNERKKQIEQMMEWKKELKSFEKTQAEILKEYIEDALVTQITNEGLKNINSWFKKYSFEELINATDIAIEQYVDKPNELIFSKIERIAYYTKYPVPDYVKRSRYVIGILRNRGLYFNENVVRELVKSWLEESLDIEDLILSAKTSKNWTEFKTDIIEVLEYDVNE
ncbi:HNH endonuclease [Staphylococcus epidermidis]|uniref:HNH endonuclease n=1 Tax=Staphylococcus epidermidis TaxID=1282 RepID=UPI0002432C6B|nr:HNH endonuclease [Staphylococcus epidermidis]EHM72873.1 HNH endonuclease domain protein [Staphylococcus epidermidis 14.1.R1.SE]APT17173.1 HNH endonuclease [Staphylococcus epidermidis]MBM6159235.1 HNH endonuclease [Staphylococcus epidermidis]MBM6161380.1 HNH endonuclease [Staphylococcus epidermidis]MBM6170359.1 HNH endonuclease [Staphylococcus epidermidis]